VAICPEAPARIDCCCDLYRHATQAVFGEGPPDARVVFVGEQPGNAEDLAGHPFVRRGFRARSSWLGKEPRERRESRSTKVWSQALEESDHDGLFAQ
jgi:uracil-DNA glycosylase